MTLPIILPDTLRSEEEIIASWGAGFNKPLVSILCITYNHASYIKSAIDSFLMQETDFPFEICIHDDASTDGTREIVEDYFKKYPKIIKVILQKKNQFSQGKKPSVILSEICNGDYYALCEGDDFWVHPEKLKRQVSALERFSEVDLCFSSAISITDKDGKKNIANYGNRERLFSVSDVILGGGGFMPTASIVCRKSVYDRLPEWFCKAPVGDYYLQVIGSFPNGSIFLPYPMSVYRLCVPGSWSEGRDKLSESDVLKDLEKRKWALVKLDAFLRGNYSKEIKQARDSNVIDAAQLCVKFGKFKLAKTLGGEVNFFKTHGFKNKIKKIFLSNNFSMRFFASLLDAKNRLW